MDDLSKTGHLSLVLSLLDTRYKAYMFTIPLFVSQVMRKYPRGCAYKDMLSEGLLKDAHIVYLAHSHQLRAPSSEKPDANRLKEIVPWVKTNLTTKDHSSVLRGCWEKVGSVFVCLGRD